MSANSIAIKGGTTNMPPPERYNTGYNVGVGGAVVRDGKLLLVRRASRRGRGNWQIPGGFVEQDETIEQAVVREVEEEAGVNAGVVGVLGIRNRYDPDNGNSIYVVLLLQPLPGADGKMGEPTPDEREVDRAGYFTLEEIEELVQVPSINREVAHRALSPEHRILSPQELTQATGVTYTLFVG
jgi:ADP-ribose pyrophosphatase YjhB (NUDIX family)